MVGDEHEALALKYRPRHFPDVAGQTPAAAMLYQICARGKVPPAMLFTGYRGCGKTSTARIVAAALNCKIPPGPANEWPCLECPSCRAVWSGTSLNFTEIDAASNGGKDEIRALQEQVTYASADGRKIIVLDEVQSMSRDAFNALLKVLEEPPPGASFILLTTEQAKVLPTVASRGGLPFRFRRLPADVIAQRLAWICAQEGIPAEEVLLRAIAANAGGAMRDAVMTLDQLSSAGVHDVARYRILTGDVDFAPWLVAAMVTGSDAEMFARLDKILEENGDFAMVSSRLVGCLKDVLVLVGGGEVSAQGDGLEMRKALAARLDAARVGSAMRVLWDLRTRVARTEPRSSLELAVKVCSERLRPSQQAPAAANGHVGGNGSNGSRPLSLDQLRELTNSR